ncbi:MAG: S1 RNA-binding domain-containing protein [Thermoguttaceae bacterium]|nr:S1 RNA-binding domain-containing protein [Thermoguttaceae bacterium]
MQNNEQNLNAEQAAPAVEPVQQAQQTADAAAPSPLATYEAMNADAPVVDASVIEERVKRAAANSGEGAPRRSSPLGAIRDENKRRREGENRDGKDGKKDDKRRERRERPTAAPRGPLSSVPTPNRRARLSDDLEDEFNALLSGESLDSLMKNDKANVGAETLEEGTKVRCRVEAVQRDSVFVDVGGREHGLIPLKQFPEDAQPTVGQEFDAVVSRFNADDGVYEVSLPLAAAEVGDWLSLTKGAIVEARVTGVNKGGLECEVGRLRGFMPNGQIAPFFVENAEQFVGERWKCVVTEVNPERRNLVVSRRVLMEREREEMREKTMAELEVGQTRDGLVRKIINVGAFVDLGGVDGFLPVSEMSWGRVSDPSEVVKEGERINVIVTKIDLERNRISLSYKDAGSDPWKKIDETFVEGDKVRGRVTNLMAFGAFVELAPGVEGLVHISEICYKRIAQVSDALQVGDFVDVQVLSIDREKRKISLSIKRLTPDPREEAKRQRDAESAAAEAAAEAQAEAEAAAVRERIKKNRPKGPLKGGLSNAGDNPFGLHF